MPCTELALRKCVGGMSPLGWFVLWDRPHAQKAGFPFGFTVVSASCVPYPAGLHFSIEKKSIFFCPRELYIMPYVWTRLRLPYFSVHVFFDKPQTLFRSKNILQWCALRSGCMRENKSESLWTRHLMLHLTEHCVLTGGVG